MNDTFKRAIVLTDISGLGNCSGAANIAVLSHFGVEPCLLPTAVLSAQTGFKDYTVALLDESFEQECESICNIAPHADAVYMGFIVSLRQCKAAKRLIDHYRTKGAKIVVDTIVGDRGERFSFINDEIFDEIISIAKSADVITPNITELCLLTGEDYKMLLSLEEKAAIARIETLCRSFIGDTEQTVIVTGFESGDDIANISVTKQSTDIYRAKRYGGSLSGTGDIFTSFICAALANGESIGEAAKRAGEFISNAAKQLQGENMDRNYGVPFQKFLG